MAPAHPLDRPIWTMLTGRQAHLAEGGDRAKRIDRGYGVFGVAADTGAEAQAALAALVPDDGELWIVEGEPWPVPAGTREVKRAVLAQMGERYTNEALASSTRALAGRIKELQPMLWERDAIKCWDKQNGTGGKRYCFKMNRIDNTAPVMDSAQLSLRHNYR